MKIAKSLFAAALMSAMSATWTFAQTADELAQIFFAVGWSSATTDDPLISCLAHFTNHDSAGYEISLSDGTRAGELRFSWLGEPQVISYEFDFTQDGDRATYGRVTWTNSGGQNARAFRSTSGRDLDEMRLRWGEDDMLLVVATELAWRTDFCAESPGFADRFPAHGWNEIDPGTAIEETVACAASFGPTDDSRRGYDVEFSDGTIFGTLVFAEGAETRTYTYRSGLGPDGGQMLSLAYRFASPASRDRVRYGSQGPLRKRSKPPASRPT